MSMNKGRAQEVAKKAAKELYESFSTATDKYFTRVKAESDGSNAEAVERQALDGCHVAILRLLYDVLQIEHVELFHYDPEGVVLMIDKHLKMIKRHFCSDFYHGIGQDFYGFYE